MQLPDDRSMRQDMYGVIWILIKTKEIAFEKMLQSNMHKITNKQYEKYQNLLDDKTKQSQLNASLKSTLKKKGMKSKRRLSDQSSF